MKTIMTACTAALFLASSQSALAFSIKLSSIKKPAFASIVVSNDTDITPNSPTNTAVSANSSATEFNINMLSITSATVEGDLIPAGLALTPGANTDLSSGPIDSVLSSPEFSVSTISAITGTLDPESESIILNIDPWILSDHHKFGVTQNLGGTATGTWDGNNFSASWTSLIEIPWIEFNADLSREVTWTLNGTASGASPIPVLPAFWLLGSGILALAGFKRRNNEEA